MNIKLAIAIPVYNNIALFRYCVQSLVDQTNQDFDVYVFDDCSTENYQLEISRIKELKITYHRNEVNLGALENMQHSYNYLCAGYEYVMVIHEDDLINRNYIETFFDSLKKGYNSDLFIGNFVEFEDHIKMSKVVEDRTTILSYSVISKKDLCFHFLEGKPVSFGAAIFNTAAFLEMNLDLKQYEEFADRPYLLYYLNNDSKVVFLTKAGYYARSHGASDSRWRKLNYIHVFNLLSLYRDTLVTSKFLSEKLFIKYATAFVFESYRNLLLAKSAPHFYFYIYLAAKWNFLSLKYSLLRISFINRSGTYLKKLAGGYK